MKALVVYYSLSGNTSLIAESIKKNINCDILRLVPVKEIKKEGFSRYIWGGKQVLMKEKPVLEKTNIKVADYDLIIIGTPVWASTYAPALNTFLSENSIENKKIVLYATCMGTSESTFAKFKKKIPNNTFLGEKEFNDKNLKDKEHIEKEIKNWIENIIK